MQEWLAFCPKKGLNNNDGACKPSKTSKTHQRIQSRAARKRNQTWKLVLDHTSMDEVLQRPFMTFGRRTGSRAPSIAARSAAAVVIPPLIPLTLEAMTLQDDPGFITKLQNQTNLPDFIKLKFQ